MGEVKDMGEGENEEKCEQTRKESLLIAVLLNVYCYPCH